LLVFEVKLALIACENVAAKGLLHRLQRAKKFIAFCDAHLL
jgi:hypothetical protein